MDTPTLLTLLGVLVTVLICIVVFFGAKRLLTFTFSKLSRPKNNNKFRPGDQTIQRTLPDPVQTLSDSGEIVIVDLPLQGSGRSKFTGQGENIDSDAMCSLKGKPIRDCIRDCNCEEFAELRQKQRGREKQW